MTLPAFNTVNQFGEVSESLVIGSASTLAPLSQLLPAKSGITALSALATPVTAITVTTAGGNTYSDAALNVALAAVVADLQTQLTRVNAMLAALKAIV